MPKSAPKSAVAAALSLLLLAACARQEQGSAPNGAFDGEAAEANAISNASPSDPAGPGAPAANGVEAVPPPDAVSHPDGYLPPAPGEPDAASVNSSGSDESPPATEDQYIRNGQAGR